VAKITLISDFRLYPPAAIPFPFSIDSALPQQNPGFVQRTFSAIAQRYDLANHVLSAGFDFLWRGLAARLVAACQPRLILDLATGSGDLARELARKNPSARVVGADFCLPMLEVARQKSVPSLIQADGLRLPFRDRTFDALTVAFGLRNMASWEAALAEMQRVLRPGGLLLVMDFALPQFPPLRGIYRLYLHHVLPRFAAALTGNKEAYDYLGSSIEKFPRYEGMVRLIESAGFAEVRTRPLCLGIAAIYTAHRAS